MRINQYFASVPKIAEIVMTNWSRKPARKSKPAGTRYKSDIQEAGQEVETGRNPVQIRYSINNSLNPRQDVYLNIKYNPIRKRSDE